MDKFRKGDLVSRKVVGVRKQGLVVSTDIELVLPGTALVKFEGIPAAILVHTDELALSTKREAVRNWWKFL